MHIERRLWWMMVAVFFTGGLGIRLASIGRWSFATELQKQSRTEYLEYYQMGRNLKEFKVLGWRDEPSAFRGPLYPSVLSCVENFGPEGKVRAPHLEAVLISLEIPLGAWLALALHSPVAGIVTAAFIAFHPDLARLVSPYETEDFYGLLILLAALATALWWRSPGPKRAWLAGFIIAVSLLCRSVLFLFPPCLLIRPRKGVWALIGASYLFLLPWVARNAYQFQRFIPFEDHAATRNFFAATIGVTKNVPGAYQDILASWEDPGWRDSGDMSHMTSRAFRRIVAEPMAYGFSCLRRLAYLLSIHWGVFFLAGFGAILCRRAPGIQVLTLLCGYFVLIYTPMTVEARYLKPLLPCLLILAGCAVAQGVHWGKWERKIWAGTVERHVLAGALVFSMALYALSSQRLLAETALSLIPCSLPKGALTLFSCGGQQARSGRLEDARKSWTEAWGLANEVDLKTDLALKLGYMNQAVQADAYLVWEKAVRLQDQGELKEAEVLFKVLADHEPNNAERWVDLGIVQSLSGRVQEARKQMERALALDPTDARACLNLGVLLESKGRFWEALNIYSRALALAEKPQYLRYRLHIQFLRANLMSRALQ